MMAGLFLGLLLLLGFSQWVAIRQRRENILKSRIMTATNCRVVVTDATLPHHPINYVNPAFLLETGYVEHEIVGRTTAILIGPDTDRASIEKLAMALQDGRPCRVALRHYRKDGTSFWNEVTLTPVEDRAGRLTSVIWVMNDVSHLRQLDRDLHGAEASTALCDVASEGMLVATESEVLYVNKAGVNILGAASSEELIGRRYVDIVHPDCRAVVRLAMGRTQPPSDSNGRFEARFLRIDGQAVDVEMSVSPVVFGEEDAVLVCFSGMTRPKQSEPYSFQRRHETGQTYPTSEIDDWIRSVGLGAGLWPEAQYRIFGYEPGSVPPTYDTFRKALHPEDRDRVLALVEATFNSDRPYDFECRILQPSGDVRFVRCRGVLMRGSPDNPIRMSGTIEDITDYKLVVAIAEERDLQFKMAMESAPSGMLMVRQDGIISLVNAKIEQLFGYTREELLGRSFDCLLMTPRGVQQHEDRADGFSALASRPPGAAQELRGLRKDGSEFPVEIALNPVPLSSGTSVLAIVVDLTARRQAEEALRDSEVRLDLALQTGAIGIFECDHRTDSLFWTPILREICGVGPNDTPSLDRYLELVHPADREKVRAVLQPIHDTSGDQLYEVEHRLVRPDGVVRHLRLLALRWLENESIPWQPNRTIGMVVDITDRKTMRTDGHGAPEGEGLSTLTAGIAHEFNNSLTAVLGFSELALPLIPNENKAHRYITQVIVAGRKARELAHTIRRALDRSLSYRGSAAATPDPAQERSTFPVEVSDAIGPRR